MNTQNPQNNNPTPPPPPPRRQPHGPAPGASGGVAPQQPPAITPPPTGQPQQGYRRRMPGQRGQGYGQGQQPPGYQYPNQYTPMRQGFPLWAWGAIGAAIIAFLGGTALVIVVATSKSNSVVIPPTAVAGQPTPIPGQPTPLPGQVNTNLGPPQWIKAGTRVTYYNAAASVAQSSFAWVEDPNCKVNCWQDPKTGKLYTRTDETPGASLGWASGDGLSQLDVLAVEGTDIVYSLNLYGIDRGSDPPTFLPPVNSGGKVPGTVLDGTWINPTTLRQLQEVNNNGLLVLRGDYPLNGVTYKAISFASTGAGGSYSQYTYDTESGLLLSATTSTKGATSPIAAPGQAPPQGNTQLTVTRLAGYRQRSMPGVDGSNPGWIANTKQLIYGGTYRLTNPVDPSSGTINAPVDFSISIGASGRNWATFTARSQIQYQGYQPTETNGATGSSGLYWVDPQALASLRPQQLLDQDPLTGEKVEVVSVGSGPRGAVVTIVSRLSGSDTTMAYDQTTGVLVGYNTTSTRTGVTIDLGLQRGP
jgi:hypothetical protein